MNRRSHEKLVGLPSFKMMQSLIFFQLYEPFLTWCWEFWLAICGAM